MTIRAKLALSISLLLIVSTGILGYGVLLTADSLVRRQENERIALMENAVRKAAEDALLQKDELLLVSYVKFLRTQIPSLSMVSVDWEVAGRARTLTIGSPPSSAQIVARRITVSHPGDSSRRAILDLTIDRKIIQSMLAGDRSRLLQVFGEAAAVTLLLGIFFAVLFSRTITAPLQQLVGLSMEISGGKLGGKLEWSSDDELGQLVKVFNFMSLRLSNLDETKKNFVSSVTHELRSPLGAIESFLTLIDAKLRKRDDPDSVQSLEYLGRIEVNVRRLGGFINDLLDVAKIEKGKMECVLKPMKIQPVAADVCRFFEAKAKSQKVRLRQKFPVLPEVMGDSERLRQVLVNLISNGLKFTPSGGEISLKGAPRRDDAGSWVEISVSDTGRGMDPRDLGRLFTAFSQGRNVAEGVAGSKGTGLGLFITKSIIEQHGGKMSVNSTPGRGTEIVFSLRSAS